MAKLVFFEQSSTGITRRSTSDDSSIVIRDDRLRVCDEGVLGGILHFLHFESSLMEEAITELAETGQKQRSRERRRVGRRGWWAVSHQEAVGH